VARGCGGKGSSVKKIPDYLLSQTLLDAPSSHFLRIKQEEDKLIFVVK
jgi:hypothetical protein